MKLYFDLDDRLNLGFCMYRINNAFMQRKPDCITLVKTPEEADVLVLNAWGNHEKIIADNNTLWMTRLAMGKPYILFFHGFASPNVHEEFFARIFKEALLVYTPWPLRTVHQHEVTHFVRGPWGYEPKMFFLENRGPRLFRVMATGCVDETEHFKEVYAACREAGGKMIHVGPDMQLGDGYYNAHNVSDHQMRFFFNNSTYVSALRSPEGFELIGLEGLACGAMPVVFDNPHYDWYDRLGLKVSESRGLTCNELTRIFRREDAEVTQRHLTEVKARFSWDKVASFFWMPVIKALNLEVPVT